MDRLPVVDFHSHILPKMDDGSRSTEMSIEMLHRMKAGGTDIVVSTSHYYGHKEEIDSFLSRREASFRRLSEALDDDCPEIRLGAEAAFYFGIEKEPELERLCIRGTNVLLLEMPFSAWTNYELNAVTSLCCDRDLTVVLAHYERFVDFQKNNEMLERILRLPLYVQINAETLLPMFSRRRWLAMFREGRAHLLGSDAHNLTDRAPNLHEARSVLHKKLGDGALRRIDEIASSLLAAEAYAQKG